MLASPSISPRTADLGADGVGGVAGSCVSCSDCGRFIDLSLPLENENIGTHHESNGLALSDNKYTQAIAF